MSKRSHYVGLDVSLAETSIAVIDADGNKIWQGAVASTPTAIADAMKKRAPRAERIGLVLAAVSLASRDWKQPWEQDLQAVDWEAQRDRPFRRRGGRNGTEQVDDRRRRCLQACGLEAVGCLGHWPIYRSSKRQAEHKKTIIVGFIGRSFGRSFRGMQQIRQ